MALSSSHSAQSVLWIISQWYSGSSILNLLLDQQEGIRGLGEGYHIYNGERDCYCSCGQCLKNCAFFKNISSDRFYEQCFTFYNCRVLVDASKIWVNFKKAHDPQFPVRAVLLSKTPHAWLYSHMQHHPEEPRDAIEMFKYYMYFYSHKFNYFAEEGIPFDVLAYDDLVAHPYRECQRLCDPFNISVDPKTLQGPWITDTHIAGGNAAVYHQLQKENAFFEGDNKYKDKKGTLFLDDSWKQDETFCQHCADAYRVLEPILDPVLQQLGHMPSSILAKNIDPLTAVLPFALT